MVATPIGNLSDITLRALEVLKSVDLVAAEDTRLTARLLSAHDIRTRLISCHEYNEAQRAEELIRQIREGEFVALVSDAGTPSVSDPGFRIVRAAIEAGVSVVPIPGASAAMAAISVSGLPTDAFTFVGFAPKKRARRHTFLKDIATLPQTIVFYESPRRILQLIKEMIEVFGDRQGMLGREMTKRYEEFFRGALSEIAQELQARGEVKGECTLLVAGKNEGEETPDQGDLEVEIKTALKEPGASVSEVAKAISKRFGVPKKRVYSLALEIKDHQENASE